MARIGSVVIDFKAKTATMRSDVKKADKSIADFGKNSSRSFNLVKKAAIGLTTALAAKGLLGALNDLTSAYGERERQEERLSNLLKLTTSSIDKETAALVSHARALSLDTGISQDHIISAQGTLATFQLTSDQIQQLTPRILDLGVVMGGVGKNYKDFDSIANAVAKSLSKGSGALKEINIQLSASQQEMWDAGTYTERFALLLDIIDGNAKGAAHTFGNTYPGQLSKLKNAFGEIKVAMGEILKVAILPYMEKLTEYLIENKDAIADYFDRGMKKATDFVDFVEAHPDAMKLAAGLAAGTLAVAKITKTIAVPLFVMQLLKGMGLLKPLGKAFMGVFKILGRLIVRLGGFVTVSGSFLQNAMEVSRISILFSKLSRSLFGIRLALRGLMGISTLAPPQLLLLVGSILLMVGAGKAMKEEWIKIKYIIIGTGRALNALNGAIRSGTKWIVDKVGDAFKSIRKYVEEWLIYMIPGLESTYKTAKETWEFFEELPGKIIDLGEDITTKILNIFIFILDNIPGTGDLRKEMKEEVEEKKPLTLKEKSEQRIADYWKGKEKKGEQNRGTVNSLDLFAEMIPWHPPRPIAPSFITDIPLLPDPTSISFHKDKDKRISPLQDPTSMKDAVDRKLRLQGYKDRDAQEEKDAEEKEKKKELDEIAANELQDKIDKIMEPWTNLIDGIKNSISDAVGSIGIIGTTWRDVLGNMSNDLLSASRKFTSDIISKAMTPFFDKMTTKFTSMLTGPDGNMSGMSMLGGMGLGIGLNLLFSSFSRSMQDTEQVQKEAIEVAKETAKNTGATLREMQSFNDMMSKFINRGDVTIPTTGSGGYLGYEGLGRNLSADIARG